jgi:hypothetical protein
VNFEKQRSSFTPITSWASRIPYIHAQASALRGFELIYVGYRRIPGVDLENELFLEPGEEFA